MLFFYSMFKHNLFRTKKLCIPNRLRKLAKINKLNYHSSKTLPHCPLTNNPSKLDSL